VAKRAIEQIPIGDGDGDVSAARGIERREVDLDGSPATSARDIETRIDDETADPGVEAIGVAQRRQVAPRSDETFLDRVASQLGVAKDQAGCGVQTGHQGPGERFEGVMIASLRSFDQVPLIHHRPRGSVRTIGRITDRMAPPLGESFPAPENGPKCSIREPARAGVR
jgi:hypothetical protein